MKHTYFFLISLFLFFQLDVSGQLPNGSIAPNWTLTDIEGNTYTLSDYLDQGKMVVLDFGETRCTPCWNYMLSGELETFWDEHGPNGLDDAMVFFVESAWETGMDDLLGLTPFSNGNWVAACPFPILDLPNGNNTAHDYGVTYYPTIFAVCHDHTLYELGMAPTQDWIDFLTSCNMEVELIDVETAVCVGDGSATVAPSGGFSPYTYQWDTGATIPTISGLISGDYNVSITEGNGKISTLQVFVPGATEPLSLSDEILPTLCFGSADGNIYINMDGGVASYIYEWNTGATTQNLLNVSSDTYAVTVTDNLGCTLEQSFDVSEPAVLAVDVATTAVSCDQPDGTITLSILGGVGNYTISSSQGSVVGNQIVGLSAGLISVAVEDGNGCIWSDDILTQYIDYPVVSVTNGAEVNCIQTSTSIAGFATGGYNEYDFQWTTADGHILSNPLAPEITVDAPGSYLLQVTDLTSGCETFATSIVANGVIPPDVDAGPGIPINCENLQLTLDGNGDSLNVINWTTPNGSIISGGDTYHPIINAPGTYTIHVINSVTNCSNQDDVIINDESVPASSAFQYLTSGLTIAGTDISTGSNLSGWNWTFGDGQSSGEQNPVHTFSAAGTYDVCLTVQNGCGTSQSCQPVEVIFTISPLTVDAAITNVLCYGDHTGSIDLVVNGGNGAYTYNWTAPDTTYSTSFIDSLPAGTYQLIVSDEQGNNFIGSYAVNQPSAMVLTGDSIVNNLCYGQSNGSVSITISGGIPPYLYSWNGGPAQPENFINQLSSGTVEGVVTDSNGCIYDAGIFTIVDPDSIALDSILVTNASGAGESDGAITLTFEGGTPPYIVSWSNGANGSTISGLTPGAYNYIITDSLGCQYISLESVKVLFTTGIVETHQHATISILPNPSNGRVIVYWNDLKSANALLMLMTLDGKMIDMHLIHTAEGIWDLTSTGLHEGLYIIMLKENEKVFPFKLVVL